MSTECTLLSYNRFRVTYNHYWTSAFYPLQVLLAGRHCIYYCMYKFGTIISNNEAPLNGNSESDFVSHFLVLDLISSVADTVLTFFFPHLNPTVH